MPIATDLTIFKTHRFNKRIDNRQIDQLVESMKKNGFFETRPILVNKKMEVLDGRQRLHAATILGIPVHYQVYEGTETQEREMIKDIQKASNWKIQDYIDFGCEAEDLGCMELNFLLTKYNIHFNVFCALMAINSSHTIKKIKDLVLRFDKKLYDETLERRIRIIDRVTKLVRDSEVRAPAFVNQLSFKKALVRLEQAKGFNEEVFMMKCEASVDKIRHRPSMIAHLKKFLDIYNFRNFNPIKLEFLDKHRD